MKINMASWKTTVIGLILAVGNVVLPLIQNGTVTWKQISTSALIAAFGFVAKDAGVTGGTTLAAGAVPDATLHQQAVIVAAKATQ
jgi:hypothetical protein